MLKLTYSLPNDVFQTVTVLGDAKGIWDLWWRLSHANPDNPTHGVVDIGVHDLEGNSVDPAKGLAEMMARDIPLSRLSD